MNLKESGKASLKTSPSLDVGSSYYMKKVLLKEALASAKLLIALGLL
jgi:hypothetical protein